MNNVGDWKRVDNPPQWTIVLDHRDGLTYTATLKALDFDDSFVERVAEKVKTDDVFRELILRLLIA